MHRRITFLATALMAAVVVVTMAGASAPPRPTAETAEMASIGAAADYVSADGRRAVAPESTIDAYWTQSRMATAVPATPTTGPTSDDFSSPAHVLDGAPSITTPAAPSPLGRAKPISTGSIVAGKIFYRNVKTGINHVCSGAAVNSGSKRLVSTAGHCVHGGPGGAWHQNWVFVPAYANGARPYGTFTASYFRTFDDWINHGESGRGFNSDVAFVTTNPVGGRNLVNAVGGFGLTTGGSAYKFPATVLGYPVNKEGGEVMKACAGDTVTRHIVLYKFPSINGCGFGGGASGGPWLEKFNPTTRMGNIRTLTSWGDEGSTAHSNGPFFRTDVRTMFDRANNDR